MVQSLADLVASAMNVRVVYGDPISAEGKTIIPVAKVSGGFGARARPEGSEAPEGESASQGGGAGGGFSARPVGLIEVTPQRTRFIPAQNTTGVWMAAAGGLLLGLFLFRRRR
jgi:uncharacterized spore protein YtfJ